MASPITTTTQVAGPVNVVFQQTLLRNAKARCPYFVGSVPAEIREHTGSFTAKWRRIENLTPVSSALSTRKLILSTSPVSRISWLKCLASTPVNPSIAYSAMKWKTIQPRFFPMGL